MVPEASAGSAPARISAAITAIQIAITLKNSPSASLWPGVFTLDCSELRRAMLANGQVHDARKHAQRHTHPPHRVIGAELVI